MVALVLSLVAWSIVAAVKDDYGLHMQKPV
jgi:hypothetical protein